MELDALYHNYLNLKFGRGLPLLKTGRFEYALCEDGSTELFLAGRENESFTDWTSDLRPADPHYTDTTGRAPVLASRFGQLDVYGEQVLDYLLLTINATTSIVPIHPYNVMNDRMKHYCFFQLAQWAYLSMLSDEQKAGLRDFFFWFYLYAHPVNGETLDAFSFRGPDLIHTMTGIRVQDYFAAYHDHYAHHHTAYNDCLTLSPQEIEACCGLTLQMLEVVEGRSSRLKLPPEAGLEPALRLINQADEFLAAYARNRSEVFGCLQDTLTAVPSTPYREHIISMLLHNYVCYILYFDFDQIVELVEFFQDDLALCRVIVNRMFTETIFIQKILWQNRIDLHNYANVTALFDENAREIYREFL
ncbi:hypothetical protein [Paenibacillus sonchi]|uniref:hypothetical protein n=1 Tax=Paenibacillus sonchi TaxID=373687 RepID=UPI001E51711D|nr:hypothetical protein [Paenibacillus sonchi]MCE3202325.1 hypothetical protein [Paenibacillus sonchi]